MAHNLFNTLQTFTTEKGKSGQFYSLPQLEAEGVGPVARLPVSIRVVLESVLRNFDEKVVEESDVRPHPRFPRLDSTKHTPRLMWRNEKVAGLHLWVDSKLKTRPVISDLFYADLQARGAQGLFVKESRVC